MRELNLVDHRSAAGRAAAPHTVEIARFKDENASAPRIVTASQSFIVYSLKSRSALRVLPRKLGNQNANTSYKRHTNAVVSAQFVNTRSNVVASASASELLVWYVDDDVQIYTYFTFQTRVSAFAWVPVANQPPDLLVVTANADSDTHTAGLLKSSVLIQESTKTADPTTVGKPDGNLVATSAHVQTLLKDIKAQTVHASAASPILAFSADSRSVVTASLANPTTPVWQPCNGEEVAMFAVVPNALLIAVSSTAIYTWNVSGEPEQLHRMVLGPGRSCTALHCTSNRAVAFLAGNDMPNSSEAFVMDISNMHSIAAAYYQINSAVTNVSSCVTPSNNEAVRLHVDTGSMLQLATLEGAPWVPLVDAGPAQGGSPPPYVTSPGTAGKPSIPPGTSGNPELDGLRMHIDTALTNTASMINVSQSVVSKDHANLVQEALKAQAKTLAAIAASTPRGQQASPAAGGSAFDSVIEGIIDPVATALVEGISSAVEDQLRSQLEAALKTVLTKQEKQRKRKDNSAEIKAALEAAVAEVMPAVMQTIQQKQVAYAARLLHYVSDVASEGGQAIQQLQQVIANQQQQLNAIAQSGLLEEVKRLRQEVSTLKSRGPTAGAAAAAPEMKPETVLANAKSQLEAGQHKSGLDWVLNFDDAALTVQLLVDCSVELREALLEDKALSDDIWVRLASCLASTPRNETLTQTLDWLCDILAEKQALTKNDVLIVAIGKYINAWKSVSNLDHTVRTKLRELTMHLSRR